MPTSSSRKSPAKDAVAPEQDPPADETPAVAPEPEPEQDGKDDDAGPDKIKILNPGTTSVVYTGDGRQIAAGERLEVTSLDETGQVALERGFIVKID